VVGSAALLVLLLRRVAIAELVATLGHGLDNWPLVIVAFLLPGLGLWIAALRWQTLLTGHGARLPIATLGTAMLVGTFFNQFLPSTVGGDVVRSWWISQRLDSGTVSLTIVVLDRALGMIGICFVAFAASLLQPSIAWGLPAFWVAMAAGALALLGLAVLPSRRLAVVGQRIASNPRLARFRERLGCAHDALQTSTERRSRLFFAILLSMLAQGVIIAQYVILAIALDLDVSLMGLAMLVPVVTLIALIPVTINGIGLREGTLSLLGAQFGVTPVSAITMAWLAMLGGTGYAVVGGLLHLHGQRPLPPSITKGT